MTDSGSNADRTSTGAVRGAGRQPVLSVRDLTISYRRGASAARAVSGVSFDLEQGDRVGLVGESGSGKSTLASAILRTLPPNADVSGSISLHGDDLLAMNRAELRRIRSTRIARVPQDPLGSLNPVFPIGRQLGDVVRAHRRVSRRETLALVEEALRQVGISDAAVKRRSYPHELSGGMRQRVMIAMALINHPELLIADEPTTALDVTVQAQVVELLRRRVAESDMTLLLISHDIGVISELCTRVMVMYRGEIVEQGPARDVLTNPQHAYTSSLIDAARGKPRAHRHGSREVTV
ncbi:peptide/nickel transport system ATP-binding protein [Micromonospora viridifaciens]|uniref:Peptide/nickel transport system ATP-binding protein n=1 Tax=Micromonospora viridifaciens TaxID=1881 RepID=A0A1C4WSA9_MICVI|nr:ABC transporter ATP-binding protein [Micromonospora viridifaciens]SCE99176.1 peptide/nickel transport system ATP-binding protein [Micromonospora viridifaciens]